MAPRKIPPSPPAEGGLINWHGTRPEVEAVLKMREKELGDCLESQKQLAAAGGSHWGLDNHVTYLTIMVKNLREELSSIE